MESLILRRNYPVPVTFADLRRAYNTCSENGWSGDDTNDGGTMAWHAALKSATGATDDVYAVVDGREVHIGREEVLIGRNIHALKTKADEQGYWERPHEVRLGLQTRTPSLKAIDAVVQRSLIEAEVRR